MTDKLAGDPSYEAGRAAHAEATRTPNTGSPAIPTLSDEGSRQSGSVVDLVLCALLDVRASDHSSYGTGWRDALYAVRRELDNRGIR